MAASFRKRRFALFHDLISSNNHFPITILDIGGWQEFWEVMEFTDTPRQIILLNLHEIRVRHPNFTSMVGDARKLDSFADKSVDVVFSNSVIEHWGTPADQQQMFRSRFEGFKPPRCRRSTQAAPEGALSRFFGGSAGDSAAADWAARP